MVTSEAPADRAFDLDVFSSSASERPQSVRSSTPKRMQSHRKVSARKQRRTAAAASAIAPGPLDQSRLDTLILARILAEPRGIERGDLARDLAPLVAPWLDADAWRARLDRTLMSIADAGLIAYRNGQAAMTDAGRVRASILIDAKGAVPKSWSQMRNQRMMALALARGDLTAQRQALLAKPDGLRAAIVETAFTLKMKGNPTPTRLRTQLAGIALTRAFGGKGQSQGAAKQGLSPRAGRELAGQLFAAPRDPKTDKRLVAELAADVLGLRSADLSAMQVCLLQRYLAGLGRVTPPVPAQLPANAEKPTRRRAKSLQNVTSQEAGVSTANAAKLDVERPDLEKFVAGVLAVARTVAEGWAGNRKAFISRVAASVRAAHPRWGLADVEFKAMLAEAHRLGRLALATIDLRTAENLKDVQASQLTFKNTHFHLIRVEG